MIENVRVVHEICVEVVKLADKIRFGLVGVGVPRKELKWKASMHYFVPSIAWARYFPQIARDPRAELTAVCDVVKERLEEVRKSYKVKEIYMDYKEMLEKADIDVVIITTPNKYHFPMALDAIRAGKHLIVEKPLAINTQEAKEIVEEAKKNKIKLMPAPWIYDKCFYLIREMIDDGSIGKLCILKSKIGHMGPGHSEWFYRSGYGAGATFDLAIYPVTTLTALAGPAKRVLAISDIAIKNRFVMDKQISVEVEDNVIINLDFGDGTLGNATANYCTQTLYGPTLEIYGSEGAIFVENGHLKILTSHENVRGLFTSESPLVDPFPNEPIIERFIDHLLEDFDMSIYGEQQIHVIEILEKALESSSRGKSMDLTTTFNYKALSR